MAASIPKKHKAIIYDKPGEISSKIEEIDTPEPGAGEVLINLTHSGVCHSDYGVMTNSWRILPAPTQAGQVGGHEGVGTVVKMGPGTENSTIKVGQRVGVKWMASTCGNCTACLAGRDASCFNGKISGYYTPGTFQQYVLGPANYVTPIPDGVDSAHAAPMLCGGVTVYSALRKSNAKSGDWVAIMGAGGGLGHLAVQIASRGMGLRVVGIDHSSKESLAKDCGAEHFFGFDKTSDLPKAVKEVSGGLGVHAVVVVTSLNSAYAQSMQLLRFAGRLVCVGIPEGDLEPVATAFPGVIAATEQSIVGSAVGSRQDAIETLELVARGLVKLHYREEKMENLNQIFHDMNAGKLQGRVVLNLA